MRTKIKRKANGKMSDIDGMILDLHNIAENRNIKVAYRYLPDKKSFIVSRNEKTYVCLDARLTGVDELVQLTHETGHVFCGISDEYTPKWLDDIYERKAWNWAATYLVPYKDYSAIMRDPFVDNDEEAAAKANVTVEILHKARKYYYNLGLPVTKAALEYAYGKIEQLETITDLPTLVDHDNDITENEKHFSNRHVPHRTNKTQSQKQYDISRIKYSDYVKIMKQPNIMCDIELAEELNTSVAQMRRARWYFRSQGLPVRQGELIIDWRQWNY